jgi:hypothetical protein
MVKKVIRFIVLIIGLSLVAYSGYHLFKIYSDYNTSDKTYEKLQDEYAVDDSKKDEIHPQICIHLLSQYLTIHHESTGMLF